MSKRRYMDDGGDHRGGRKRRRMVSEAAEIEDRLESLIIRVGEKSTSSLESNLEGLASVLEADLGSYKARILRILADCARRFPEKCSIYTTLIGLINVKNYNFGGEFVEVMVRTFKDSLKSCDWASAQYTLRFIADLVNCHVVSIGSLLQLINNMVDVTTEEGVPQVRKDWYVFAVLTCLPWIGRELYEQRELELDRLLGTIELYLHGRNTVHRKALCVWTSDSPHPQEEYLECLWAQMRKLKADGWQEKHIIRPWLAFDTVLCEALQHNLPPMLPPPHHADYRYPLPSCVFRLFDYTDCPDGPVLPGSHSIERFLIEEQLHYTIEQYHFERKDCAAQLLNFPAKTKVPLEYMIVEVIFSEMLALPAPRYLEICYGSVFIELCKLQPSTMPQVLAQATEMLYERIDTMNCCAFERLISWFSYHLSNFQYRWSWEDWAGCLSLQPLAPKRKFVSEVLEKGLRLTYIQRLVEILPEKFRCLLPIKPDHDFIYERENGEGIPGAEFSKQLIDLIKSKPTTDDVVKFLNQIDPSPNDDAPNPPPSPRNWREGRGWKLQR